MLYDEIIRMQKRMEYEHIQHNNKIKFIIKSFIDLLDVNFKLKLEYDKIFKYLNDLYSELENSTNVNDKQYHKIIVKLSKQNKIKKYMKGNKNEND